MSSENVFHDTKNLPPNVLLLVDDSFYTFVEERLGLYQSLLLKIQQINSVSCFLLTNDPCDVLKLDIKDDDLSLLKTKVCFVLSDGSFVVKPGFKTGFKCLRDILSKKTEEKLKQLRNTKTSSATAVSVNMMVTSSPFSTPQLTTTVPPQTTSSTVTNTTLTTTAEHRKYFLHLLRLWCSNHKEEFMSDLFDLQEGKDFILNILYDENDNLKVSIKCNCGKLIGLTVKDGKIQLSNYQKHLRSTNCSHIKSIKKMNGQQQKVNISQSTDTLSSSTSTTVNPSTSIQQGTASQASNRVSVAAGTSTVINSSSTDTQTQLTTTNSRKRGHSSSQLSSSQKPKRNRT